MATVFYTSTEAIRAALGVTEIEITDAQITDLDMAIQLEIEVDSVYADHAAVKAAVDAQTATPEQEKVWKYIKLFCQYQGAVFMLPGIQNTTAQKLTDGDFEMQRFMKDSLAELEAKIIGMRDRYRGLLSPDTYSISALIPNLVAVIVPTYDPVTGEG